MADSDRIIVDAPWTEEALLRLAKLSPQSAHAQDIPLEVTLLAGTTSQTDTYKIGSEWDVLVWGVTGYLRFGAWTQEVLAVGTMNLSLIDRVYLKSSNCLIDLRNTDNQLRMVQDSTPLSSYMPSPFGAPNPLWPVPYKLPAGSTVELKGTLQDTTTSVVGGSTVYGVRLHCTWLRVKG